MTQPSSSPEHQAKPLPLRCASGLSTSEQTRAATAEACEHVAFRLDGAPPDLMLCFFSNKHVERAAEITQYVHTRFAPGCLIGCSADGVLADQREVESEPAVAIWAAHLPGCTIKPFALEGRELESVLASPDPSAALCLDGSVVSLVFADPFTTPLDGLLAVFDIHQTGVPVLGGLASVGTRGQNRLLAGTRTLRSGAVGVSVAGPIRVDCIVSQGCRPIGKPLRVTSCQQNVIHRLNDEPALACFEQMVESLSQSERMQLANGVFIGRAVDSHKKRLGRGDFLIRAVMEVDAKTGAMAVGDLMAPGMMIQFHVRDAVTAREDLELLLTPQGMEEHPAAGALLFSCNGRGNRLYGEPDVDARTAGKALGGAVPQAGFFAAGEIGPIQGRSFVHGHTVSMAIFRPEAVDPTGTASAD